MKRFFKVTSYILIAVLFSIALSGCTKKATNANANNIIVWSFESDDVWAPIKTEFESTNKGYTLTYVKQTLDSTYENRVLNSILSGQGPDIWSLPNDWVYRHKDKLVPRPATKEAFNIDDYVASVKQSVFFDNNVYALSPTAQPLIVFYNPTLIDKDLEQYLENNSGDANQAKRDRANALLSEGLPSTWTDFIEATKLLTVKQGDNIITSGLAMGTDKVASSQDILYLLMLQNETKIISDDLKLAMFNLPTSTPKNTTDIPGKRAMDFYASFADPKSPNYSWNNSLGNNIDAFASGKAAIIIGYDEIQNTLSQKYPNFSYKMTAVPQLTQETDKFVDYAKFNALGVSSLSPNSTIAWSVIDNIMNNHSEDFASALKSYTSKKSSDNSDILDQRKSNNPEKVSLLTAKSLVKGRYPVEFDSQINDAIFAVNKGVQDSQSALDLIAQSITSDLLRKETW